MSQIWGPLGWMTLHSISLNYPDNPSLEDRAILDSYMKNFAGCITCPSCRSHFSSMFTFYKQRYPEWNSSKFQLFLFIARAHNTVNKRLDKPIIFTVASCLQTIQDNSKLTSLPVFRHNYIRHVSRNWEQQLGGEGRIMLGMIREVQKINNEYWNIRETSIDTIVFPEADVTEYIIDANPKIYSPFSSKTVVIPRSIGFKFRGGRLMLGGR
jgi:hypothetical protein